MAKLRGTKCKSLTHACCGFTALSQTEKRKRMLRAIAVVFLVLLAWMIEVCLVSNAWFGDVPGEMVSEWLHDTPKRGLKHRDHSDQMRASCACAYYEASDATLVADDDARGDAVAHVGFSLSHAVCR
ncbi:hypothetical protein HBI56_162680 [Parastagonospora nodorum]|nr:hypothetical protein HBH53_160040 [Parastagonospora nodorum]KAH4070823.1 hypothetical protein HBH50_089450 [Parastagonospora nodorum]KAH4092911.1 hypothetical protein HBH48_073950 [Parastagonospora nodorum]KAH4182480.1 hypothetical protein HBH42_218010 [Parastagonospora nodorum]KAH4978220.1 hypothetical protein HBI76_210770 [Parastagonospora nodorum]